MPSTASKAVPSSKADPSSRADPSFKAAYPARLRLLIGPFHLAAALAYILVAAPLQH